MFGNSYNNNNEVSVNTRATTLYSDLSCLQLGFWNTNLSLKVNPIVSIGEDGARKYDFDKRISTALTQEKSAAMLNDIDDMIIPEIKKVESGEKLKGMVSISYPVGKGSVVSVEYKEDEKTGTPSTFLTLYRNIKADNTSDEVYSYQFNKSPAVKNYDATKGSGDEFMKEAEFFAFVGILRSLPELLGASYHGSTHQSEYSSRRSNKGQYGGYGNRGAQGQETQASAPKFAPISSYSDEDLPF